MFEQNRYHSPKHIFITYGYYTNKHYCVICIILFCFHHKIRERLRSLLITRLLTFGSDYTITLSN